MTEESLVQIKNIVNEFFIKTGITDFEIKVTEAAGDNSFNVLILMGEARLYIGEGGKNIGAFETILRLIIKKQLSETPLLRFDINNYRSLKDESLRELAK